jgi:hypothetical protein
MKQINMFGEEFECKTESSYTSKIITPEYLPNNKKPHILELFDDSKTKRIINEIKNSNISEEEKKFLITSASRHTVFNYQKIADYYSHSQKEMQELMERQALVIIDFDKAYQYGYIKLAQEIANQYFDNYGE